MVTKTVYLLTLLVWHLGEHAARKTPRQQSPKVSLATVAGV